MKSIASAAGLAVVALVAGTAFSPGRASAGALLAAPVDQITALTSFAGSGTSLALSPDAAASLQRAGIAVTTTGTATAQGSTLTFPITSGYLQVHSDRSVAPGWIEGSVGHDGSGITLRRGAATATLANFSIDPGDSLLSGTIDGTQTAVPLLALDGSKVTVSTTGAVMVIGGIEASWTPTAATVLDVVLQSDLRPVVPLGTLEIQADASALHPYPASDVAQAIPHIPGGASTVAISPAALATFSSASVAVTPSGTTTASTTAGARVLSFPVTGGIVVIHKNQAYKPGFVAGSLAHEGSGLTFSGTAGMITATNLVADPGDSILTATVGADARFPLLFLNGSDFKAQVAQLTPTAARLLDRTFATTTFTPYMTLGPLMVIARP